MTLNPTVVVGVGEAGVKMTSQVYEELLEMHDVDETTSSPGFLDDFLFITIDTREQDLDRFARDEFHDILLEPQSSVWEKNKKEFDYIHDEIDDLDPAGGASRQRPTARFYIDNAENFDDLYSELQTVIHTFADNVAGNPNLWIMNSYGGGTGSGAFPLLTAILDEITDRHDKPFWFGGIGSLPRLDELASDDMIPAESKNLYANAYSALRELGVLIDYDFADDTVFDDAGGASYPFEIELESDPGIKASSTFEIKQSPYDFYGLMGLDESEGKSHKRMMNRIAANTVLFFSEESGLEDFGDDLVRNDDPPILYSISSSGVQVPVDGLKEYTDLLNELNGVARRLRDVRFDVNQKRANRDVLRRIVDLDAETEFDSNTNVDVELLPTSELTPADANAGRTDIEEIIEHVSNLQDHATEHVDRFEMEKFSEQLLDDRTETMLNGTPAVTDEIEFDPEPVVEFFYYQQLAAAYRELENDHSFPKKLEREWENIKKDIPDSPLSVDVTQLDGAGAVKRWDEAVADFIDYKIRAINNAIDDTGFLRGREKRKKLQNMKEEWEAKRESLQPKARAYKQIVNGREMTGARASDAKVTIRNFYQEYDSQLQNDLEPKESDIKSTYRSLSNRKDALETKLEDPLRERFTDIPFTSFEDVSPGVIESADSIVDLVSGQVIEKSEVVEATRHAIESLEENLEDVAVKRIDPQVREFIGLLSSEANEAIVDGTYDAEVAGNGVKQAYNNFKNDSTVSLDDEFSLRMVGLYAQILLENTSEFGTIHELYRDADENVGKQFGVALDDDEFITSKFAYPELFPDDARIPAYFGIEDKPTKAEDTDLVKTD